MKRLIIAFLFTIFSFGICHAQDEFEQFASRQTELMTAAYEARDWQLFEKLLNEFLPKFNALTDQKKKQYASYHYNALYNLCCTYALTGQKDKALDFLRRSVHAGFSDYQHMQKDPDLEIIRNNPQFATITEPARLIGDYRFILRRAGSYNEAEVGRNLPAFTYQPSDNANLQELRKAFHLDSVAGGGNDVSKMLNLMHWIHNLVPHDGNHENPVVKNALSMINECKREDRGLNCRGLATVLNECYLSLGFKSRFVTCLPKDSLKIDMDCHVINMVYSNDLKKWIWIDPTFDAYVMNEKGEMLGIEEVRQRIIKDQPLILNPDANWNHRTSQTKDYYLYQYMAKNLYILECPVSSEYDTETKSSGKTIHYLQLVPLDYFDKSLEPIERHNKATNTTQITYKTNNPALFWQAPK